MPVRAILNGMSRTPARLRFAALVLLVAALGGAVVVVGLPEPRALAAAVERFGVLGPVLAVAGTALLSAALVPRWMLSAAGGLLFGSLAGATYTLLGALLGAVAAFGVARWLGRDLVAGSEGRVGRVRARLDAWLAGHGVLSVLTVRSLPVAPFGLVSYAFGTTGVRWWPYLAGTTLGATPSALIYARMGATALSPGTPAFVLAVAAAVVTSFGSILVCAWITRRTNRRRTVAPAIAGSAPPGPPAGR